jgi:hypothetical protein
MRLVGKVWRHTPIKFQIDPTGNHGVMPLGHNPSTRLMPLGHKVRVYGRWLHIKALLFLSGGSAKNRPFEKIDYFVSTSYMFIF